MLLSSLQLFFQGPVIVPNLLRLCHVTSNVIVLYWNWESGATKAHWFYCANIPTITSLYVSVYAMVERHFEEIYAAVYSFLYARDTLLGGSSGHVDVREG